MPTDPPPVSRARRRFPGPIVLAIVLICTAGLVVLRLRNVTGDHAVDNVLTLILTFIPSMALLIWFSIFSGYSAKARFGLLGLVGLVVLTAVAMLRVDDVSGDLVPTFRFRWQSRPDEAIAAPAARGGDVDLAAATPIDFPQFLGPERSGKVTAVQLGSDWSTEPPELVWKQPIGAGWSGFVAVNGFAVTMEQRGSRELVTCYEALTGKPRWHYAVEVRHETTMGGVGPRATPTIADGRVYAVGATGVLSCLDGSSGSLLWSHDLPALMGLAPGEETTYIAWGRAGSPLIVDDLAVVPGGGKGDQARYLVAFDKDTGNERWRSGTGQISYSSPVIGTLSGVRQIIVVNEGSVTGHRIEDGQELWSFPWPSSSSGDAATSQPLVLDDGVLISKGYGAGAKRMRITSDNEGASWQVEEVWTNRGVLKTKLTSAVVHGSLAFGLSDGILECVDLEDGSRRWKGGRYGHGQMLLVGDQLLVSAEDGRLLLVRASADRHEELAEFTALEGKSWNTLCLYGRHLLIRNAEQAACYALPITGSELAALRGDPASLAVREASLQE